MSEHLDPRLRRMIKEAEEQFFKNYSQPVDEETARALFLTRTFPEIRQAMTLIELSEFQKTGELPVRIIKEFEAELKLYTGTSGKPIYKTKKKR